MEQKYDDTFLARLLADELSAEELSEFKKSKEYSEYNKIIEGANRLEAPSFDRQKVFDGVKEAIAQKSDTKVRKLPLKWMYAAAAVVILFLGYNFLFNNTVTYDVAFGEKLVFELPDASNVLLNADSKVSFKPNNWDNNRSLTLSGEAFFKVKKGSSFTVNTKEGQVTVLGTQFTVNSRNQWYEVKCFEGKVEVKINNQKEVILTMGQAISFNENTIEAYQVSSNEPSWVNGESTFENTPIFEVIEELERQYNITIQGKNKLKKASFTGRFSHNDLDKALKTIFVTMEIPYTFDDNKVVTIKKY